MKAHLSFRVLPALVKAALVGAALVEAAAAADAPATTATTQVVAVEGSDVVLGAGRQGGLAVDSQVTLLREGEPIVHPLTGEVLGVPQEPVGTVHVFEVSDQRARGGVVKVYSAPRVGDTAEYQPVPPPPPPPPPPPDPAVTTVMREMAALKKSVEVVRQHDDDLKGYPDFARRVADEIGGMRLYLRALDKRLGKLEAQQSEDHSRLTSLASGEQRSEGMKEFTIRYAPDTQVRLRTAGKILVIDVIDDSLRMAPLSDSAAMAESAALAEPAAIAAPAPVAKPEGEGGDLLSRLLGLFRSTSATGEAEPAPAEGFVEPWYKSIYHLAAGVGLTLAMLVLVFLVIKRRYTDVMEGLEEFEDEYEGYLEEDEDEDEDDDDDK